MYWQYNSTGKHVMIGTLLLIVSISVLLGLLLHKKEEKYKNIPLIVITALMLIFEIAKQIQNIVMHEYTWWSFPLHFCSLFLYFFPLATFAKGKVKNFGLTMSFVCACWMTILFYINPQDIIGNSPENIFASFGEFHRFFHHHLVVAFLFTGLALNMFKITKKSFLHVVIGISIYAAIGLTVAHLTDTNYCNLLHSNIPFMENFRVNAGQVLYTIAMWIIGVGGGCIVCGVHMGISALVQKNKKVISGDSTEHIKK